MFRNIVRLVGAAFLIGAVAGCSDQVSAPAIVSVSITGVPSRLLVGSSTQLTAVARDASGAEISSRAATWSSSDTSVIQVAPGGMARVLRVGGPVTITARIAQTAGTATVTPRALTVRLSADSLLVGETRRARAVVVDASGAVDTLPTAVPVFWETATPDLLRVTDGVVLALRAGRTTVSATVEGVRASRGVSIVAPEALPDTLSTVRRGTVVLPSSMRGVALTMYAGLHGIAPVNASGAFEVKAARTERTVLQVMLDDRPIALGLALPGEAAPLQVDALSTAVTLLLLSPSFSAVPGNLTTALRDRVGALADVRALGRLIEQHVARTGSMPDTSNAEVRTALITALRAANPLLSASSNAPARLVRPPLAASGVQISWPTPVSASARFLVQNRFPRDVMAWMEEADEQGRPLAATATGTARYLGIADYVDAVTSLTFWVTSLLTWNVDVFPEPVPFDVTFTPARPRQLLLAYGLGGRGLASDVTAVLGRPGEASRLITPVLMTGLAGIVLPTLEAVVGFKLLPSGPRGAAVRRLLSEDGFIMTLASSTGVALCLQRAALSSDVQETVLCVGRVVMQTCLDEPSVCAGFVVRVARVAGVNVAVSGVTAQLKRLNVALGLFQAATAAATVVQTVVAVSATEMRQEFDLSYHDLIGATRLVTASGDRQTAPAGSTLPEEIVVRVENAQLQPVSNAWVVWTVTGGGSVQTTVSTSDARGLARVRWTLGTSGAQSLEGRLAGTTTSARASATIGATAGSIRGQVRNAVTNALVIGAQVNVLLGSTVVQTAVTTGDGQYQFNGLASNTYRLVVTAPGFRTNSAESVRIVTVAGGDAVLADFALPPVTSTQQFGALSGRVLDNAGTPVARAAVTLSGGIQTNGVFRATQTAADGTFALSGVVLTDASNRPITSFTLAASAEGFLTSQRAVTLLSDRLVTNQDLVLQRGTPSRFFADGFEAPSAWTATGLWNRSTLGGLTNSAVSSFVQLAPNDASQGRLPSPATGTWAFWYGSPASGNFLGTQATSDRALSGGTSAASNTGLLTSPPIVLPQGQSSLQLRFDTWFEIESVNPNASGYDIMEVIVVDGTSTRTLGRLNPFVDPTLSNRAAIPFTSGGFNLAPIWRPVSFDLTAFAGRTIQLRFSFRTVDARYNGFRGWIIDNVTVTNTGAPATLARPALQEFAPDPPPRREW